MAQRARLEAILRAVRGTRQEERWGLRAVRTARELQDAVPLRDADEMAAEVDALYRGTPHVLTREAPVRFELSGGSTGASKRVPMTPALLGEFHAALSPWLFDLLDRRPALRRGPGYWSVSPIGEKRGRSPGGVPVGSAEDTAYFPALLRPLLRRAIAVPGEVALLPDVERCRYVTLWHLVASADLTLISVWNPSFLTLLVEALDVHAERLAHDLAAGRCSIEGIPDAVLRRLPLHARPDRAQALRSAIDGAGRVDLRRLWPTLSLISLWTDAEAARVLAPIRARFPGVELQGKGLLATEGVVTLPLLDAPAPVLAVRSHLYEFLPPDAPATRPLLAHELTTGQRYDVVLSTSGGLLRYRLGDRVEVAGFQGQTPCLRFLGRSDAVCDLVGEKLATARARSLLEELFADAPPRFAMLAPEWSARPAYQLLIETDLDDAALLRACAALDAKLCEDHAFGYARRLGQLGPVTPVRVTDGARRYEARCIALGQRAGDVKPTALHRGTGWREALAGVEVRGAPDRRVA